MADKKISALTAASTPLAGTEVLPIVQSGSTVKASVNNVLGPLSSVSGLTAGYILKGNNTANVSASIAFDSGSAFGIGTNSFTNTVNTVVVRQSGTGVDLGGTATTAAIRIRGGSSGAGLIDFYPVSSDPNSAPFFSGRIFYDHGVNTLAFSANSIEALKLTNTGNVNVSTGNLVMATAGKGIDFSANGGDVLSQYDEGTWNPTVTSASGTLTSYTASGTYTRIGRMVTAQARVQLTNAGTATGALIISNPIAMNSTITAMGCGRDDNTGTMLQARIVPGLNSSIYVLTYINSTVIATGNDILISISYFV